MEFLCYHRDRPDSLALRNDLSEAHWAYLDGFESKLIACGPTPASDGDTPTGSLHIVNLPSAAGQVPGSGVSRLRRDPFRSVVVG